LWGNFYWSDRHVTQNLKFELFFCSILSCDGDLHHFENSDNYLNQSNEPKIHDIYLFYCIILQLFYNF